MDVATSFYKRNKVSISIFSYNVGEYDFKTNVANVNKVAEVTDAIELPQELSKDYLRKLSDTKYTKGFVVKNDVEVKPNYVILFNNKRYNVKEVIDLTDDFYMVTCHAMLGESTN